MIQNHGIGLDKTIIPSKMLDNTSLTCDLQWLALTCCRSKLLRAATGRLSIGPQPPPRILCAYRRVNTAHPEHRTDRARSDMGS